MDETPIDWLRANLTRSIMGGLTGTDIKALNAAHHILELLNVTDDPILLKSFSAVVLQIQNKNRYLAFHLIAMTMCWVNRPIIWKAAKLEQLKSYPLCKNEPNYIS